jgi:glycosyltransferase involved in cell wall biosynthesis
MDKVQIRDDADLRQRLVTSARQLVQQRYDWTQIGGRFVKLIEYVARHKQIGTQVT